MQYMNQAEWPRWPTTATRQDNEIKCKFLIFKTPIESPPTNEEHGVIAVVRPNDGVDTRAKAHEEPVVDVQHAHGKHHLVAGVLPEGRGGHHQQGGDVEGEEEEVGGYVEAPYQ